MRNMIDLTCLIVYLCALNLAFLANNLYVLVIIIFISIIYVIKFIKLKERNEIIVKIGNDKLKKQHDYFIEVLKHNLQIPAIAQLRGVEILRQGALETNKHEQQELLELIENSCKDSLDMIKMLLNEDYSRYKAEETEIFNLLEILEQSIKELNSLAEEKHISLFYTNKIKNVFINADKENIKRVIINLLSNAINNSKQNDKIYINTFLIRNNFNLNVSILNHLRKEKNSFLTVGENIKMSFCKHIIEIYRGKIIKSDKNNFMLGFEIPMVNC